MIGPWINLGGVLAGGLAGLTFAKHLSARTQLGLKRAAGALLCGIGLKLIWDNVGGTPIQVFKQLGIGLLALSLGNLTGALLRFQRGANVLGRHAAERFTSSRTQGHQRPIDAVLTASLLYAANPISIIGPIHEALSGNWLVLAAKAALDGLATLGFIGTYGAPVMLSGFVGWIYQSLILLAVHTWILPQIADRNLIDALGVICGFIVASSALIALELRRVSLANFLPALLYAPLLTAWLR